MFAILKTMSVSGRLIITAVLILSLAGGFTHAAESPDSGLELKLYTGFRVIDGTSIEIPFSADTGLELQAGQYFIHLGISWFPVDRPLADFSAGLELNPLPWLGIKPAFLSRLTSFGPYGLETRAGIRADFELGNRTLFIIGGSAQAVYTRFFAGGIDLVEFDPGAKIGVRWKRDDFNLTFLLRSAEPYSLWLKTSFALSLEYFTKTGETISAGFSVDYSDFFTLTSYIDGFSLSFGISWPLWKPEGKNEK